MELRLALWAAAVLAAGVAAAQDAGEAARSIEVLVVTPLGGDAESAHGQSVSADALGEGRALDLAAHMKRNLASVFVNEAQSNPLQPDVQYRGFVGSPLLGLPQGIAVYQNGVRINEPFGDTVNWALIPEVAIAGAQLLPAGASPLFGLNALGGAVSVATKTGFTHPGTAIEGFGGSFGRMGLSAETGRRSGRFAYYAAGATLREDGWRDYSPTESGQAFASLGWQGASASVNLDATLASTDLIGNGALPVQLWAEQPTAIYTRPDQTENDLKQFNITAERGFSANLSWTGNLYARLSDIATYNGDDADDDDEGQGEDEAEEEDDDGEDKGEPLPATINRTSTRQDGYGFAMQLDRTDMLGVGRNRLVAGIAYDAAGIDFDSSTEAGILDQTRLAVPNGTFDPDAFTEVGADIANFAVFLSDTVEFGERLAATAAARYNRTSVELNDRLGTALDGSHRFSRLNPALAIRYRLRPGMALYASLAESSRAPSPVELTCADEDAPCRLPNSFLADPPLDQVVARTLELGVEAAASRIAWRLGWFRASNEDDILFISAGAFTNEGYFDNVGRTERRGWEFSVTSGEDSRASWFLHYTLLDATFRETFTVPSANHPRAQGGELRVQPGARLPLVPKRLLKAGVELSVTDRLGFGADLQHVSGQHYRGDEANLVDRLDGYAVANIRADFRLGDWASVYATLENVLDERYATFGVFGEADEVLGDDYDDSRFVSPGAPRAGWLGLQARF